MLDFTLSVATVWIGQLLSGFTFLFEQKCILLVWCLIVISQESNYEIED